MIPQLFEGGQFAFPKKQRIPRKLKKQQNKEIKKVVQRGWIWCDNGMKLYFSSLIKNVKNEKN